MNIIIKTHKKVFWVIFIMVFIVAAYKVWLRVILPYESAQTPENEEPIGDKSDIATLDKSKSPADAESKTTSLPQLESTESATTESGDGARRKTDVGPELSQDTVNQTTYGRITKNETWRNEIRITGDIKVASGVTLTIEPGTIVKIAAHSDKQNLNTFPFFDLEKGVNTTKDYDQYIHRGEPYRDEANHISIRIKGILQAVGTPDKKITITSDDSIPGRYDWNVFNFENGRMEYVVMEYYRAFGPGNGAVVKNSVFRHVGECAICANSSALVEYNQAFDTGHEIVDMHNSSPTIRYNQLGPSVGKSGIIIDGGSPQIIGNHIFDVRDGINFISPPENPLLEGNTFKNTEENIAHNY